MQELNLQTSLRDLVSILFKRKWSLLTVFTTAVFAAAFYTFFIRDDLYQVSARVLVRMGHENEPPSTLLGDRPLMIVGQRAQDVNSEADILTSTDLLGRLVDEMGLDKPEHKERPTEFLRRIKYDVKQVVAKVRDFKNELLINLGFRVRLTRREEMIAMLQKGLLVTPQKDSNVLVVNLFLPSREYASAILNTLLERYQEFRLKLYLEPGAQAFFQDEVDKAARALADAEERLREFEQRHGIRSLEEQQNVLLKQISDASMRYDAVAADAKVLASKVERLDKILATEEPDFAALGTFEQNSFPASLMLQLADLQREREKLMMTPASSSSLLENNRQQFKLFVGLMASNLRSSLSEAELQRSALEANLTESRQTLDRLNAQRITWEGMQRDMRLLEATSMFYRNKLEQASAAAAMERERVGNVKLIEQAIDPLAPTGMRKTTLLGIAVLLAVLAALAYVAVLEFFDHRIYSSRVIEQRMGVPVLAVVPAAGRRGRRKLRSRDGLMLAPRG